MYVRVWTEEGQVSDRPTRVSAAGEQPFAEFSFPDGAIVTHMQVFSDAGEPLLDADEALTVAIGDSILAHLEECGPVPIPDNQIWLEQTG